jgi:hypothetical protein
MSESTAKTSPLPRRREEREEILLITKKTKEIQKASSIS